MQLGFLIEKLSLFYKTYLFWERFAMKIFLRVTTTFFYLKIFILFKFHFLFCSLLIQIHVQF